MNTPQMRSSRFFNTPYTRNSPNSKNKNSPSALSLRSGKGYTPVNKKGKTPASIRKIISRAKSPWSKRLDENSVSFEKSGFCYA